MHSEREDGEIDDLLCTICQLNKFKYKCPQCNSGKSCSISCFREHKKNCTRTNRSMKFVALEDFSDSQLDKDFVFLERVEGSINESGKYLSNLDNVTRCKWIDRARQKKIKVFTLPHSFSKHTLNKTRYQNDILEWTVEIQLQQEIHTMKVSELDNSDKGEEQDNSIKNSLPNSYSKIINNVPETKYVCELFGENNVNCSGTVQLETVKEKCFHWITVTDLNQSLMHLLEGKSILEFPTFRILPI